jgi:oxepin-CoA hydrolase/3-oxo-5,6-dehydrosuberyl-CoA semialdehyde dehydrogenase
MARVVRSYVGGRWHEAKDDGTPVRDAVTGDEIARVSSAGVDMGSVLDYGRRVGGPALRELSFHQRASILKLVALYLRDQRDELYALSTRTGATRRDAQFDVDGGISVLFSYSSTGRRYLPNGMVYVDGDVERLGKGGTFVGQHICTPLHGVTVQINAFNFPVWGPLEKLAPTFLAGVPTLIKPATQTAYVTERLVEMIVESQILPEGTLQIVCGSTQDLFDYLTEQDLVAFTGSAATARNLRTHPVVVERAVRFNAEADSLNFSILGPDATPDARQVQLFVDQLVTEMTVKAGQKCTAIRRAFVPVKVFDHVEDATIDKLTQVTVGNPANSEVNMGALASLEQREEVRKSVEALSGAGPIVYGDPRHVDAVDADADRGAFISPMLLRCDDPTAPQPHEVEAFGPVSVLVPYKSVEEAVELAGRGRGSLVGSVVTDDADFARAVVLGVAPWHGRVLVLDEHDAPESTGHGSPLPPLVHGGPGRAGGGEEMGGIRGVLHHMQRTAVQGSPDILTAITKRWVAGASRHTSGVHPFRKHLEDLRIGDAIVAGPRKVTIDDIERFAGLTGDRFYAHMDEEAAKANPFFDGRVAHGYFVVSLAAGLFVAPDPGPVLANYGLENLRFVEPTYPGDELTVTLTVMEINPRNDADYGEVRWDAEITKETGAPVATYEVLMLVAKRQ